jgi:hypothetical protein
MQTILSHFDGSWIQHSYFTTSRTDSWKKVLHQEKVEEDHQDPQDLHLQGSPPMGSSLTTNATTTYWTRCVTRPDERCSTGSPVGRSCWEQSKSIRPRNAWRSPGVVSLKDLWRSNGIAGMAGCSLPQKEKFGPQLVSCVPFLECAPQHARDSLKCSLAFLVVFSFIHRKIILGIFPSMHQNDTTTEHSYVC